MTYRDDLDAAHARIEALEAELERLKLALAQQVARNLELESDARLGRELRTSLEKHERDRDSFDEAKLREKMRREEAEVEAEIRAMRENLRKIRDDD